MTNPVRVGLIGAGYIASWHADALKAEPNATVTAVCDLSQGAAEALAGPLGARAFTSVEEMIAANICDAVHVLTPPDLHKDIAIQCLEGGLHVLVEKPVATSAEDTRAIQAAAEQAGRRFHAGHNFLGLPSYERMKAAVQAGAYGRILAAELSWALPLPPLRSGPFNIWPLRQPKNLLLELAPHLVAFAHDLFGPLEVTHAEADAFTPLPGGDRRPQSFRILARGAGGVAVTFLISTVETMDDRSVTLRGSGARVRLDFAQDTLVVEQENTSDLVVNPLRRQLSLAGQHLRQGLRNGWVQGKSLNRRQPYALSFSGMARAIYGALARGEAEDPRFAPESAVAVMQMLDDAIGRLPQDVLAVAAPAAQTRAPKPSVMVIGGTGFIGRELTRRLVAGGRDVRVLSRGRTGPFPDLPDSVETVSASLRDVDALAQAMAGIDVVFNLARSDDATWEDCLKNDVGVARIIAEASQKAGVRRLVYTGTIASYDMSDPAQTITEATGFAEDMTDRHLYARSKAECEKVLMQMHRDQALPLVIARPGIVVGPGGPLQHWGIARWHGAGAARIWGPGQNILPFVLNSDVADGLIAMIDAPAEAVEGQSFNLVGEPMLTARDYFDAIHRLLGARVTVTSGNLRALYATDMVKYALKKHALRRPNLVQSSLVDWKSRAHFSPFVIDKPKEVLGWRPEADRDAFLQDAVGQANLFGF